MAAMARRMNWCLPCGIYAGRFYDGNLAEALQAPTLSLFHLQVMRLARSFLDRTLLYVNAIAGIGVSLWVVKHSQPNQAIGEN